MYQYEVVGFKPYSGEFEGRPYKGYTLHCVQDTKKDGFEGRETCTIKAKEKFGYTPRVGDTIWVTYGPHGIEKIDVA